MSNVEAGKIIHVKNRNIYLNLDELRLAYSYDPITGIFTHLGNPSNAKFGTRAGSLNSEGYISMSFKGQKFSAHRLAWMIYYEEYPELQLDHINCVRHDNRIANLRVVTQSQNALNKSANRNNVTGYKGVRFQKHSNKYGAYALINGKEKSLGRYKTAEEAREVCKKARKENHGQFARD